MRLVKTVVMVIVCSIATWAQSNQGGITGTVFDRTVQLSQAVPGLKLYRLRQAYDTSFGVLGASPPYVPRYIQFGLRIFS